MYKGRVLIARQVSVPHEKPKKKNSCCIIEFRPFAYATVLACWHSLKKITVDVVSRLAGTPTSDI